MLKQNDGRQKLYVRVNALDTGLTVGDLAAVVPAKPDGIVLPKCEGWRRYPTSCRSISMPLKPRQASRLGHIRIVPVATETARAVVQARFVTLAAASDSWGLMWGGGGL